MQKHIFIYVVKRSDDPFLGIKEKIINSNTTDIILDITLSDHEYELVRLVEYSWRRYVRLFFYKKIFKKIEIKLLSKSRNSDGVLIYLSDEGVWAEVVKKIARDIPYCKLINVQHGFFTLTEKDSYQESKLRKLLNKISCLVFKYPAYGFGFGGAKFDSYICYGEKEKNWLMMHGIQEVEVNPKLIKHEFIARFNSSKKINTNEKRMVFLLPTTIPGSGFCKLSTFLEQITPLIKFLSFYSERKVLLRLHPGGDTVVDKKDIASSSLKESIDIDKNKFLHETLADNPIVLSANSTALFEAHLVGRCAIAVATACYHDSIHYLDRKIDLREKHWKQSVLKHIEDWKVTTLDLK